MTDFSHSTKLPDPFLALAEQIHRDPVDSPLPDWEPWELAPFLARPRRRLRRCRPRIATPGGLLTPAEAAGRLGCSVKTLNGHVASGAIGYVLIGHGRKRPRKMFTDGDIDAFIVNQSRRDAPCPFVATSVRRSGSSIFKSEVIGFSALQKRRRDAKPKP